MKTVKEVSELTGINLNDIKDETLRVLGKGGKERVVYLNEATQRAIEIYLQERKKAKNINAKDEKADEAFATACGGGRKTADGTAVSFGEQSGKAEEGHGKGGRRRWE